MSPTPNNMTKKMRRQPSESEDTESYDPSSNGGVNRGAYFQNRKLHRKRDVKRANNIFRKESAFGGKYGAILRRYLCVDCGNIRHLDGLCCGDLETKVTPEQMKSYTEDMKREKNK